MTTTVEERPITEPVSEPPSFEARRIRDVGARALGIRFLAGPLTSVVAGGVTLVFGSRAGGILLAFPAILAASLTLIEQEENSVEAREDGRGAVIGGLAMALFAAIAAVAFGKLSPAIVLPLATAGWFVGAIGGYLVVWFR